MSPTRFLAIVGVAILSTGLARLDAVRAAPAPPAEFPLDAWQEADGRLVILPATAWAEAEVQVLDEAPVVVTVRAAPAGEPLVLERPGRGRLDLVVSYVQPTGLGAAVFVEDVPLRIEPSGGGGTLRVDGDLPAAP